MVHLLFFILLLIFNSSLFKWFSFSRGRWSIWNIVALVELFDARHRHRRFCCRKWRQLHANRKLRFIACVILRFDAFSNRKLRHRKWRHRIISNREVLQSSHFWRKEPRRVATRVGSLISRSLLKRDFRHAGRIGSSHGGWKLWRQRLDVGLFSEI